MTTSAFGVVLRCEACGALVPVRRYDPDRRAWGGEQEVFDGRPAKQWKLADSLGLADRDVETPPRRALLLNFPGPKPQVGGPTTAPGATAIPSVTPAPEGKDSMVVNEEGPDLGNTPPVDI
jgi:hypothetical protein